MASKQIDLLAAGIVDSSGNVLQSGTVELYEAGTSTPVTGYSDSALSSSLGSTITLDSRGAKLVFVSGAVDLKLIVKDSDAVTVNTYDGLNYQGTEANIIESDPEFLIRNTDQEDTDGGRQSIMRHRGEQSGGEISTLATATASHSGTGDDQKGKYTISVNDGNDGDAPSVDFEVGPLGVTVAGTLDTTGNVGVTGNITVTGTVDGVDLQTLNTAAGANTTHAGSAGTDHSDVVLNNAHRISTANPHTVTATQVGLGNNDNTSDANKPVSTAQQTALNLKSNITDTVLLTGSQTVAGAKTFSDTMTTGTINQQGHNYITAESAIIFRNASSTNRYNIRWDTGDLLRIEDTTNAKILSLDQQGHLNTQGTSPVSNDDLTNKLYVDTAVSDIKYKENIVNLNSEDSLGKVLSINAVSFEWKQDATEDIGKDEDKGLTINGFIAQDIEEYLPEAIVDVKGKDGEIKHKAIRRDSLIPIMWSAIKELEARIKDLESV